MTNRSSQSGWGAWLTTLSWIPPGFTARQRHPNVAGGSPEVRMDNDNACGCWIAVIAACAVMLWLALALMPAGW